MKNAHFIINRCVDIELAKVIFNDLLRNEISDNDLLDKFKSTYPDNNINFETGELS